MERLNTKTIAEVLFSISNVIDVNIGGVSTDSRNVRKGDLFIAIKGEAFDGHDFVEDVVSRGVEVVVVEKLLLNVTTVRQIVVDDSRKAYAKIGKYIRDKFHGKVIALTGSAGKTTTKEELAFILAKFAPTYASRGNFNNDIGVPRSLCEISLDSSFAVFEIGMSAKNEISNIVSYVSPDIAIVTNVYPMHIEFFEDISEIAMAKAEIFEGLSENGVAVINEESNCFEILIEKAKEKTKNIITYGKNNIISVDENEDVTFVKAKFADEEVSFEISDIGGHHVYNALCVLAVVKHLGLDLQKAGLHIKDFGAVDGRGKKHTLSLGKKGHYILIDDSYSGQPEAMRIAIQTLDKLKKKGRKIAVLGKMSELGKHSKKEHIEVGKVLAKSSIDVVVAICPETKDILDQLDEHFETHYFENNIGLDEFLLNKLLQDGDIMLIKGARYSSSLYQTAEILIKNGEK